MKLHYKGKHLEFILNNKTLDSIPDNYLLYKYQAILREKTSVQRKVNVMKTCLYNIIDVCLGVVRLVQDEYL